MTWGQHYWPWFLTVSGLWIAGGFGIPEGIALLENPAVSHVDNTLSWYARVQLHANVAIAGDYMHTLAWWVTFLVWVILFGFLTLHIWFFQFG